MRSIDIYIDRDLKIYANKKRREKSLLNLEYDNYGKEMYEVKFLHFIGCYLYPPIASLRFLPAINLGTFFPAISISAPVCGFLPFLA